MYEGLNPMLIDLGESVAQRVERPPLTTTPLFPHLQVQPWRFHPNSLWSSAENCLSLVVYIILTRTGIEDYSDELKLFSMNIIVIFKRRIFSSFNKLWLTSVVIYKITKFLINSFTLKKFRTWMIKDKSKRFYLS